MGVPTGVERLQAAIEKLDRLISETVHDNSVGRELTFVALRMVQPVREVLRVDVALLESCTSPEQRERVEQAAVSAGDIALADAILGES